MDDAPPLIRRYRQLVGVCRRLLSLSVVVVLAAACGGGDGKPHPSPTGSPSGSVTAPATVSVTASRSPSSTATAVIANATPSPPPSTATPLPTATAVPSPTPASGTVITNGPRDSGLVALTFDMGGRVEPALDIMNWLVDHRVAGTIFMTGAMVENQNTGAGREVLALIDAHRDLFDLGNHSYSHPDFRDLTAGEVATELARTAEAIARYTRVDPKPLFRPPFGGQDATVVQRAAAAGYTRTVMWDVDTIDWRPESEGGPTIADIVTKVTGRATGGSIVLMHLGGYNTFAALPDVVEGLRGKGLGFATVSDLLGIPR